MKYFIGDAEGNVIGIDGTEVGVMIFDTEQEAEKYLIKNNLSCEKWTIMTFEKLKN